MLSPNGVFFQRSHQRTWKASTVTGKTLPSRFALLHQNTPAGVKVMSKSTSREIKQLNEIGKRSGTDRRVKNVSVDADGTPIKERRVKRRRQIDPTTCERDYSDQEVEFMRAMDEYKRASGRMFPTCSEILEVLRGLGYEKVS